MVIVGGAWFLLIAIYIIYFIDFVDFHDGYAMLHRGKTLCTSYLFLLLPNVSCSVAWKVGHVSYLL